MDTITALEYVIMLIIIYSTCIFFYYERKMCYIWYGSFLNRLRHNLVAGLDIHVALSRHILFGRHLQQYFSYIVEVSFLGGGNHRLAAGHWQTLSHNIVSSTPRLSGIRIHNIHSSVYKDPHASPIFAGLFGLLRSVIVGFPFLNFSPAILLSLYQK
jgi:hypothetical protein